MMNVNIMIITNLILDLEMIIMKRTIIKVITMNMNNHETKRKIEIQEDNLERTSTKEAFEAQQYEQPYDNHFDHDYANREQYEETDDKYSQFPKRAVESEYASSQNTEEEPEVMSRQAKYNKKSKKRIAKIKCKRMTIR